MVIYGFLWVNYGGNTLIYGQTILELGHLWIIWLWINWLAYGQTGELGCVWVEQLGTLGFRMVLSTAKLMRRGTIHESMGKPGFNHPVSSCTI